MAFSPAVAVATPLRYYGIRLPERAGEDCTCGEGYRIGDLRLPSSSGAEKDQ